MVGALETLLLPESFFFPPHAVEAANSRQMVTSERTVPDAQWTTLAKHRKYGCRWSGRELTVNAEACAFREELLKEEHRERG